MSEFTLRNSPEYTQEKLPEVMLFCFVCLLNYVMPAIWNTLSHINKRMRFMAKLRPHWLELGK